MSHLAIRCTSAFASVALLLLVFLGAQGTHNDTVHIIFSNHLDVGFGGIQPQVGMDSAVINKYFHVYYPLAVKLGRWFEDHHPGPERHVYTAHAFVASLFLSCPPGMGLVCPSEAQQVEFREAVRRGHITWTALPFNAQPEVMDPSSLQSAVRITQDVDADVGVPHKTVMSQRDVPGLTRAAIPVLVGEGIRAISVGVNGGSAPPGVPQNEPFVWRDAASNTQVLAFWHPFGYGGHVFDDAGNFAQLTPAKDCVRTPPGRHGGRHILCFSWRQDNNGPYPDPRQILTIFDLARRQFPGAKVIASTFEAFVDELAPFADELPVVEQEIGDTWIYGLPSDPVKVKRFLALQRMRSRCLLEESCTAQDAAFRNFTRLLLKVPEHTWGLDTWTAPGDFTHWTNAELREQLRSNPKFATAAEAWTRQLRYIDWAVEALHQSQVQPALGPAFSEALRQRDAPHPVEDAIRTGAAQQLSLSPCPGEAGGAAAGTVPGGAAAADAILAAAGWARGGPRSGRGLAATAAAAAPAAADVPTSACGSGDDLVLDSQRWVVRVDASTGAITTLMRKWEGVDGDVVDGTDWAADGSFARILYSAYDEAAFHEWATHYSPFNNWAGLVTVGTDGAGVGRREEHPRLTSAYKAAGFEAGEEVLVLRFEFDDSLRMQAGAPANMTVHIRTWADTRSLVLDVHWAGKAPTRVPEAIWFGFSPGRDAFEPNRTQMWKTGSLVSPLDVVRNGSHSMHMVGDGGVLFQSRRNEWEVLQLASLDAPVAVFGRPQPMALPDFVGPADVAGGVSFCLFNNVWGTNYIQWFPYLEDVGVNMKFRFVVTVRDTREEQQPPHWHIGLDRHFADIPPHVLA